MCAEQADQALIRTAVAADADAIHAMIRALAAELDASGKVSSSAADIRRFGFSDPPAFHVLIAEKNRVPVGLCLYFFSFSTWRGTRGIYVQDIYVTGSERGKGLASRLLGECARRASEQGARFLRLSVDRDNAAARNFYHRLGIRHAASECIYMALGEQFESLKNLV